MTLITQPILQGELSLLQNWDVENHVRYYQASEQHQCLQVYEYTAYGLTPWTSRLFIFTDSNNTT